MYAYGPVTISGVFSAGSIPIRHEEPICFQHIQVKTRELAATAKAVHSNGGTWNSGRNSQKRV